MKDDIENALKEIFNHRGNFKLDEPRDVYDFEDWEYLGKIHIRHYLRRSFAQRINDKGNLEYGIFNYYAFEDDIYLGIIVDPSQLKNELIRIIDSEEDDWAAGPM